MWQKGKGGGERLELPPSTTVVPMLVQQGQGTHDHAEHKEVVAFQFLLMN